MSSLRVASVYIKMKGEEKESDERSFKSTVADTP